MKIVVTGALGHIGSRFVREVPTHFPGSEIVMIDNLSTQRYCSLFDLPDEGIYRFIEDDILTADIKGLVKEADVVLHLAAITDAAGSFENRERVEHVNFNATVRVAEACGYFDRPMIHLSSTSVYGTQKEIVSEDCTPEDLRPQSPYAETKLREERYLQDLGNSERLRFVTCRFGTICGISPGIRFHTAVNKFCYQAVMGKPLTVWKTALNQKRPYLTIDDAVRAICFIIQNNLFDRRINNVLTANLTVNDILKIIREYITTVDIAYVDSEIMNQLSYEVANTRFKNQGFEFRGDVRRCISDTLAILGNAGGGYDK